MNRAWRFRSVRFVDRLPGRSGRGVGRPSRTVAAVLLGVLVLSLIGAAVTRLGGGQDDDAEPSRSALLAPAPPSDNPSQGDQALVVGDGDAARVAGGEGAAMPAPSEPASGAEGDAGGAVASSQVPPASEFDRKIVRNANLKLSVQDVSATVAFVRETALAVGGFVFSSSTAHEADLEYGQIVVQVPFAQFDAVMNQLRHAPGLDRVERETTTSQDVTAEYVDSEARIRNLQRAEQSYQALLDKATSIEEIVYLQGYLTQTRGEIEVLQGRLRYLDNVTTYSSISVEIAALPAVAPTEPTRNAFVRETRDAWEASLSVVLALGTGLAVVAVFSWWLVPPALIAYAVARHRRARVPAMVESR